MGSNNYFKSNLMNLHNYVQSSMIVYPKEMIIATLRDFFSKDDYYHYSKDAWGFANTTDHTDQPLGFDYPSIHNKNGVNQEGLSTRIFIGENYRFDGIYYPAVLVKSNGSKYVPISLNREQDSVQYTNIIYEDGYGNKKIIHKPEYLINAGAWEGSIVIDVICRSLRARDDIVESIAMCFTDLHFQTLEDVGIVVKPLSIGSPSESDDRNDKLFKQSINLDIRTEWRRQIPIGSIIDAIVFAVTFQNLSVDNSVPAHNLEINTEVSITDILLGL